MNSFDISSVVRSLPELWIGLEYTLLLVFVSLGCGAVIGLLACLGRLLGRGLLVRLCAGYTTIFRGIPEVVLMFWIYYCGPLLGGVRPSSLVSALVAMSLYAGALLSEVFRGGILAVPKGQAEAARSLGVPEFWVWTRVLLPQAFRIVIPALIGVAALTVKVSGIASTIGVTELVYQANVIAGQSYRYFELFTAVGLFYFLILFPMSMIAKAYERRLAARHR
jgi:His/Glu/Gln/Arg/opine family amino acid ABC transporter permease subunit